MFARLILNLKFLMFSFFNKAKVVSAGVAICCVAELLFGASGVGAAGASLFLSPNSGSYKVGQTFSVAVYVSSAEQSMNAVSATVSFPADKLEAIGVSKSGSILTLWIQEPNVSNASGKVNIDGVILNPGFQGSSGKIVSINFKAKKEGSAIVNFSAGSVLANDGLGTEILKGMGKATFTIGAATGKVEPPKVEAPKVEAPKVVAPKGAPAMVMISSATHPDQAKCYANNNPEFSWQVPAGAESMQFEISKDPKDNLSSGWVAMAGKQKLEKVEDGIWYFSVRTKNKAGISETGHYRFCVDVTPPRPFNIFIDSGGDETNPAPILIFNSEDDLSGVDHYDIQLDAIGSSTIEQEPTKLNLYRLPALQPGMHSVIIKAVDALGNSTTATATFEVKKVTAPTISNYPEKVETTQDLVVKGNTLYAGAIVSVYLVGDAGASFKKDAKADEKGNWTVVFGKGLKQGNYQLQAKVTDLRGAISDFSEPMNVAVSLPMVIDYRVIIIALCIIILVLTLSLIYSLYRVSYWKGRAER
jgi:hypothetical protein